MTVQGWADDKAWTERVGALVSRALPVLATKIGQPWPRVGGLTIQEAVGRSTGGYAGLFDPDAGEVEIGYFADDPVVLHEAAHAWFNGSLLADRWANEAFASYYGFEAAADLDIEGKPDELTPELEAARIPLNAWRAVGVEERKTEDYAYAASLALARAIAERAGDEGLKAVWTDATKHVGAYQPPAGAGAAAAAGDAAVPAPETVEDPPDWRGFLDLLDAHSATSFEDLWRKWVTRPEDESLLDLRRAARAQYDEVVAKAADWQLPKPVRDAMRAWRFGDASGLLREASTLLDSRATIEAAAAKSGLTLPGTLRTAFEAPGGFAAATQEATAEGAAIEHYDAAVASRIAEPNVFQTLGLWDTAPESSLTEAREAFAAGDLARSVEAAGSASAMWASAEELGRGRAISIGAGALAILLALGLLIVVIRGWRRRRRTAGSLVAAAGGVGAAGFAPGLAWTPTDAAAAGFSWTEAASIDSASAYSAAGTADSAAGVAGRTRPPAPPTRPPAQSTRWRPRTRVRRPILLPRPRPPDTDVPTERVVALDDTLAATSAPPEAQAGDEAQTGAGSGLMGLTRTRPSHEILSGDSADVYFARADTILEREGRDPLVTMEVFARQDGVLCGIDEARNLLGHVLARADPTETQLESLQDGDAIGPKEIVLRIRARYRRFGLYETAVLGMLAQSTGWATAARDCVEVAAPEPVISFGARHVHPDITDILDYAAIVGGCVGASTPAGARLAGLAPTGTMPHSLVLIFGDTVDAALAFDRHVESDVPRIVLVDTFKDEAEEALRVARALGDRLYGIRLDTPAERGRVTAELVHEVRARLDQAGFGHVQITVSGGLNPDRIRYFKEAGAPIDSYAVGSYISGATPIDYTGDIKEIDGVPIAKRGRIPGLTDSPRLQKVDLSPYRDA